MIVRACLFCHCHAVNVNKPTNVVRCYWPRAFNLRTEMKVTINLPRVAKTDAVCQDRTSAFKLRFVPNCGIYVPEEAGCSQVRVVLYCCVTSPVRCYVAYSASAAAAPTDKPRWVSICCRETARLSVSMSVVVVVVVCWGITIWSASMSWGLQ